LYAVCHSLTSPSLGGQTIMASLAVRTGCLWTFS
jgi:hypothetical protein